MKNDKNKVSTPIEYRIPIPPHWDYSNPEGRYWLLQDGSKVSKGEKINHTFNASQYERKKFVHNFRKFSSDELKVGMTLSKYMMPRLDAPGKYYTICPKNYLYDHLGILTKSILWQKPHFSYLDILMMFSSEIKEYLKGDKNNVCIIEKRLLKDEKKDNKSYFQYKKENYVILTDSDSEMDIMQELEKLTNEKGAGIVVLGYIENISKYLQNGQIINEKFFNEVTKYSYRLYYPIYDNESFMIWETPPLSRFFARLNIKNSDIDGIEKRHIEYYCGEINTMPLPEILIMEKDINSDVGGFMLYRYTKNGQFAGDTWHMDIEQAKSQADFEYGEAVGKWQEIPKDVTEPLKYVLGLAKKN